MSILDDAIREHLELKRAHGADADELKKLEDEAFGPPQRPDAVDAFAEAPTEFLGAPEAAPEAETALEETSGRRMPNIADLQEPPPPPAPEPPAIEEQPAIEQPLPEPAAEAPPEPPASADAGPSTEERHVIAEQPTELFDVEAEMEEPEPPAEPPSPSDEQLADAAEVTEPRLAATPPPEAAPPAPAPPEPAPAPEPEVADEAPSEEYEEDDFFSEQRLSEELDQALEAPVTEEHPAPGLFDREEEEPISEERPIAGEEPISEEYEEGEFETGEEEVEPPSEEHEPPIAPSGEHEDVLEHKPDFLEDEEDDDLWFEQRPPKDFDFDD